MRLERLLIPLRRFADRRSYPVLVGAVAASDYFVPGAPTNALLVAAVLPRPERWRALAVAFAVGCATGALLLSTLVGAFGEPVLTWLETGDVPAPWQPLWSFIDTYGLVALATLAVSPAPVRMAVSLLALTGTSPLILAGIVLSGRLVFYGVLARLTAKAPQLLSRFRPFARVLRTTSTEAHRR